MSESALHNTRPPAPAPLRRGLFVALLLLLLLLGLTDVQVVPVFLPLVAEEFQVGIVAAGGLVTLYSVSAAVWAMAIGPLSDRYGREPFLLAAGGIFALASYVTFAGRGFALLASARMLTGMAGGIFSTCILALVADLFPFSRRGRAMGWVAATYSISAVAGVPAGAFAAEAFGWRWIFLLFAVSGAGLSAALWLVKQRSGAKAPSPSYSAGLDVSRILRREVQRYLSFWRRETTRRGLWLAVAVSATSASLLTYLSAWLIQTMQFRVGEVGQVFLVTGIAMVLGSLTGGWISDRIGKRSLFAWSSALLIPALLSVFGITQQWHVFAFCLVGGLLLSLREGPYQAIITGLVAANERGAYLAMRSTTAKLSIAASAAVAGWLFSRFGFRGVSLLSAGFSSMALWIILTRKWAIAPEQKTAASSPELE